MRYPQHIAIIADGNRTWASERGLPPMDGHFAGAKNTIELFKHIFSTTDTKVVTGWFLSTENMQKRSAAELDFIFGIYKLIGNDLDEFMAEHHISFKWIGNRKGIPQDFLDFLDKKAATFNYPDTDKYSVFALNYGGRDEIIRGIHDLAAQGKSMTEITESDLTNSLELADIATVELVIRTKWDEAHRTSGFMTRWIGYAELYFSEKKYPDFTQKDLDIALERFDAVADKRNFGK